MKFSKIVCIDETGLTDAAIDALCQFTEEIDRYSDIPANNEVIIERAQDADVILVSWNTTIDAEVIAACEKLKYIGMCCSLYDADSANVDIKAAQHHGITVKGVKDYGDEGVVEFIISELIQLLKGLGQHQWKPEPVELTGRKLGIIGMGKTGSMLADAALAFGMEVYYYSRTRKTAIEAKGIGYLPLDDLLSTSDIISTHLPKHTTILNQQHFSMLQPGAIIVNTSLGPTFHVPSFLAWVGQSGNYAILDADGASGYTDLFNDTAGVILSDKVAGWTSEARNRLSRKVVDNIRTYLKEAK
ncbi:MAG: NAD(P)-dependent oxidoreductase [Bacteroidota bacterium]